MAIQRKKLSGAFRGNLWAPHGVTDKMRASAAQYDNQIEEMPAIIGRFEQVEAFGDGEVHYAFTERYEEAGDDLVKLDAAPLLVPDHGQLLKALGNAPDGAMVEVCYRGAEEIQSGKWAGRKAHTYDVSELVIDGPAPF